MTFHSGFDGKVTVNGTELPITEWSVNPGVRIAETDNSKSGGFMLRESSGGKTADFSINADLDFDANLFGAPTSIVIGTKLTNVKLLLNGLSGLFWLFPSAVVVSTPQTVTHSGTNMVSVQINGRSDGTFSYPGGTTP